MNPERVGRDGRLELTFERKDDRTVLTGRRFTLPLQALEPAQNDDGSLYLMLLNPTGGIVGGDHLRTNIKLGTGAHVIFTTTSATKAYRTCSGPAAALTEISVGEGAIIEYMPDHLIPHADSEFRQTHVVRMESGSRAIIFDAMAAGRVQRGERWRFRELINEVQIVARGKPVYINRTELTPLVQPLDDRGWMEGFSYIGSLVVAADGFIEWDRLTRAIVAELDHRIDTRWGVSRLAADGCVVRIFTNTATSLNEIVSALWSVARRHLLELPPFVLRKY